ncbi:hypothetical protein M422DRAFT_247311 [Sphaerobolus stellatus SS14]|nr:hypothetical protein M422DRAFT_247311 [Sphaerobolus stellatus SS14]
MVDFSFQDISEKRTFDVMNLENYDVLLGTPFLFQHGVMLGFNPTRIAVGSNDSHPIRGPEVSKLASMTSQIISEGLVELRKLLRAEAADLCKTAGETPLPPLRAIIHRIPLLDSTKTYKWRPSRCPEPVKSLWQKKRDTYLQTGRWRFRNGSNAVPMLIVAKKPGPEGEVRIRTVIDKREQNANTRTAIEL